MGKPANSWRNKGIDIAAWRDDSGRHSFTLRKQYLNKQSQTWVDTKYLYPEDLKALRELLDKAIEWNSGNAADRREHEYAAIESGNQPVNERVNRITASLVDDDIPF